MKDDNVFETCLGLLVSVGVLLVVSTLLDGWALSTIWNWFIPTIFNLPVLTLWQAVGVGIVLQLFVHNTNKSDSKDTKDKSFLAIFLSSLVEIVARNVLFVVVGWIIFQLAF